MPRRVHLKNEYLETRLVRRRIILSAIFIFVLLGVLLGRLYVLQIVDYNHFTTLSDKNRFREWKLAPERGIIKDFFDQELASNEPLYQAHLVPENTKNL